MEQHFELADNEIKKIRQKLVSVLMKHKEISFAYLFGSFGKYAFRDIDVGAYCLISQRDFFDFELEMSSELQRVSEYTVDFKAINFAPVGFQFSVIDEGTLLFERDTELRLDFIEDIGLRYMDYYELSKAYLKELAECTKK